MIDIPASLIERIKARQAVLVSGLGCSRLASLPGWDDLAERMLAWLDEDKGTGEVRAKVRALLSSGRRSAAIAYLRSLLGDETIAELVSDAYPPKVAVPESFARVAEIPWRAVITTAFDDLWDRALHPAGAATSPTRVFLPHEAAALEQHRGRFLLHVFGSAATPESLCLSPADLRRRITPTGVVDALDDLYEQRSFVFVGFEPGDPDLKMVSERLLGANANHAEHFFFYGGEAGFEAELLRAELGMTPVPWTGTLDLALRALGDTWAAVAADARPPETDIEAWTEIWTRDPADDEAQAVLRRAEQRLRAEKDWETLVDLLLGRVERIADRAEQLDVLREVGRIFEHELGAPDRAFAALSMAFGLAPESADVLPDLLRVVGKAGRWGDFVPEYAEIASRVADPAARARHGLEIARIYAEELGQPDKAIAEYRQVMAAESGPDAALGPSHGPALRALCDLLARQQRWAELLPLLSSAAERETSRPRQLELRLRIAELQEKTGDFDAAIAALEAVVSGDAINRQALRSLEKLYDRQGRDQDYLRTIERLCETADDPAERLMLLRRLAAELEERPEGLERAAEALEQILAADPRDDDAFRALGRVYRQGRRWGALGEAMRRKIEVTDQPAGRRELHAALGKIYDEETREPERALEAYASAEALGDHRETTLEALARLYEERELWRPAADALDGWAKVAKDPAVRTAVLFRAASMFAGKLDDKRAAEERYARVLEADPSHVEALDALAALYRQKGDFLRAGKLLLEVADRTQNRIQKVRLLHEVGTLYQDKLDDEARAADLYAAALAVDPEHVAAAERLVPIYTRAARWADLEPVLDMLARKSDPAAGPEAAADVLGRLAFAAQKVGNADKALRSFEAAHKLAPASMPVLAGLAELRMAREEWGEAAKLYRSLLAAHQETLPAEEIRDIHLKLARCETGLGDRDAALAWYEKAAEHGGLSRQALEEIASLHKGAGDYAALVLDKRALGAVAGTDDDTQARLCEEIGDIEVDRMKNPSAAIAAYQAALAVQPNRRQTLQKVLDLYTTGKQWAQATDALVRIAELETDPALRAKYVHSAALIRRDELGDTDGAIELFNWALDEDPGMERAFEAIERLLVEADSWKELARNYRKMIKRLPGDGQTELRLRLWNNLGEVSLEKLKDVEMATTAFEVASSLDPGNAKRHEALADLYVQAGPDKIDKAIGEHQTLLARNPDRLASYRALAKLYRDAGAGDKLWCVAATLTFLRKADADLRELHERHKPREPRVAKRPFNDEIWEKVVHPQEDPFVDAVFMLLGHFVAATAAQQHQAVGLRRKDRVDAVADQRLPMRVLRYVSQTLELPAPDVFYRDADAQGLSMLNLQEKGVLTPAFVIGQGIAQRTSEPEVVFELAKGMAFLRPERFLRYAVSSPAALDIALRSALVLGGTGIGHGEHNGEVDKLTDQLRRMVPKPVAEQMAIVGRKLLSAHGEVINMHDWMVATDLTAARVGFVLSNDLGAAARVISAEPAAQSLLPVKQRMKDLLSYSVSEEYFAVRKFLGLDVG